MYLRKAPWFRVKVKFLKRILVFYFNMEPRLKCIFRVLQCSAVGPVLSCGGLPFVWRWSTVRSAVVCGGLRFLDLPLESIKGHCPGLYTSYKKLSPIFCDVGRHLTATCRLVKFVFSFLLQDGAGSRLHFLHSFNSGCNYQSTVETMQFVELSVSTSL